MPFSAHFRRLAPFLAFYLLLVSVGLPLQRVYCACAGEVSWQLFDQPHECKHDQQRKQENSCELASTSCCARMAELRKSATQPKEGHSCTNQNCGSTEVVMAQFDADFTILSEAISLPTLSPSLLPAPHFFAVRHPSQDLLRPHPIRGPDPPPPPFGRQLLVLQQRFLI